MSARCDPDSAGRGLRLWIVDPSENHPEDEGVGEVLGCWRGEHRVFRPCLVPGDGPDSATGYDADGVVVMGSAASVDSLRSPGVATWLERLATWAAPVVAGEQPMPLLGICFGHQLVAHLAGGRVGFARRDHAKRVGVEVSHLEGGRLLVGRRDLHVVVSHREEVQRPPPGYRITARRDGVAVDGLEHESLPLFTFQFHPEARGEFAAHAGIDPAALDDRIRNDGRRLLEAFRKLVENGTRKI